MIEKLIDEILKQGEEKIKNIEKETEYEKVKILEEARERIESKKREMRQEMDIRLRQVENKELISERVEMRKISLLKKQAVITRAFDEAEKKILSLDFMQRLVKAVNGAEKVYVNKKDVEICKHFKEVLAKDNIKGGIIADFGDTSMDISIENIMKILRNRYTSDVGSILFS